MGSDGSYLHLAPLAERELSPQVRDAAGRAEHRRLHAGRPQSEKDAKLAQKLGQLQHFLAVLPQECMGQLASFGPT